MAKSATVKKAAALPASGPEKIRDARYLVGEDRFFVVFESGKEYGFARSLLECDDGTDVRTVDVDRGRFFFEVTQASGKKYEVPWDRVLHEAEASYPYFRGRLSIKRPLEIGKKIKELRETKGLTQDQLAGAAGLLRPNLARFEAGKHRPTMDTLEKIAAALKVPVVNLIAGR
jgi:DNA-binding XRE family transcriptional regulator